MPSYNKMMLMGRVIRDPEMTTTKSGLPLAKFTILYGRNRKNADGTWENDPNGFFMDCTAFGSKDGKSGLVEVIANYVRKGSDVFVEGQFGVDQWEDKETGKMRTKHKLTIREMQLLGSKDAQGDQDASEDGEATQSPPPATKRPKPAQKTFVDDAGGDDDIPF